MGIPSNIYYSQNIFWRRTVRHRRRRIGAICPNFQFSWCISISMFSAMANPKMTSVLLYRPPNPPRGRLGGGQKEPPIEDIMLYQFWGLQRWEFRKWYQYWILILLYKHPFWHAPPPTEHLKGAGLVGRGANRASTKNFMWYINSRVFNGGDFKNDISISLQTP